MIFIMTSDDLSEFPLGISVQPCPYISGNTFLSENTLIPGYSGEDLTMLFSSGYRHFNHFFFRPVCDGCRSCIPIRVKIDEYRFTRNDMRVLRKNSGFDIRFNTNPAGSQEHYNLYCDHKNRFTVDNSGNTSCEDFLDTFFPDNPCSHTIELFDRTHLAAAAHIDLAPGLISALYTYWDPSYRRFSPGKALILLQIRLARERNIPYLYLGYYVEQNRHMNYKSGYRPNQILARRDYWIDFTNADGSVTPEGNEYLLRSRPRTL